MSDVDQIIFLVEPVTDISFSIGSDEIIFKSEAIGLPGPQGDPSDFGGEPGAVYSSTSGQAGTADTASRSNHSHDLGVHAHIDSTNGGALNYAAVDHDHDTLYAALSHDHTGVYSAIDHDHDSDYAPISQGVTGGNSHDHSGGDGAQIQHTNLGSVGVNDHHARDHDLAGSTHNAASLAAFNLKLTDATLDDSGDKRDPNDHTHAGAGTGGLIDHANLASVSADQHHNQIHDNADHSATYITSSGVTFEALDANSDVGAGTAQVAQGDHLHSGVYAPAAEGVTNGDAHDHLGGDGGTIAHSSLGSVTSDQHHNQIHVLTGGDHTESGLTAGHFLKATGTTTFDFAAHGLTYSDVGAASSTHNHDTNYADIDHDSSHIKGGSDEIDGDQVDIDFTPSNYTPSTAPAEASDVDHLTAHLAGIDDALAGGGVHVLATTTGLGANHTVSGLTAGLVLRATSATTAAFEVIDQADLPGETLAQLNARISDATLDDSSDTRTPASHGNEAHSSTFITSSSITFEALDANSDVGTGADQVAAGNHAHDHSAITGVTSDQHHNQAHDIDGADHTASGLTGGHFLKADSATTFSFQAHGLTKSDIGLSNVTDEAQIAKSIGTTKGDIIVFTGSATPVRLEVGSDDQVLTANSGQTEGVKWQSPVSGPGSAMSLAYAFFLGG